VNSIRSSRERHFKLLECTIENFVAYKIGPKIVCSESGQAKEEKGLGF